MPAPSRSAAGGNVDIAPSIGATIDGHEPWIPDRASAVAKRSSPRRARSRKRRGASRPPAPPSEAVGATAESGAAPAGERERRAAAPSKRERRRRRAAASSGGGGLGGFTEQLAPLGERPQAPWHPLPLSELLILVGIIGTVVGVARGEGGRGLMLVGIGAVAVGTIEFTYREHMSGYRPHTTLLAFVPTALFHSAVAVGLALAGAPPAVWVIAPLVLDVPLFALLFKVLRARFL